MSVGKDLGRRGVTLIVSLSAAACSGNRTVYPKEDNTSDAGRGRNDAGYATDSGKSEHVTSVSSPDSAADNTESSVTNQTRFLDGGPDGGDTGRPQRPTFLPEERPLPAPALVEPDPVEINAGDLVPPLAVRLARFIWRSEPDATTVALARNGELEDAESVYREAQRLLADPRASQGFSSFFGAWAEVVQTSESGLTAIRDDGALAGDGGSAAAFSGAARSELDAYFMALVTSGAGLRDLVRQSFEISEPVLSELFTGEPTIERVGVFSQPFLLAAGAHPERPSPSRRGAFIARRLLCQDFSSSEHPAIGALSDDETVRDWLEAQTKAKDCAECHSVIDPLGFALDGFDQHGRARSSENGRPIDTSADLGPLSLPDADGSATLGTSLLHHRNTLACVLSHWFKYALQREPRVEDEPSWVELVRGSEFYELREVPALIAATQSFRSQ